MNQQAVVVFLLSMGVLGGSIAQLAKYSIRRRLKIIDVDLWTTIFRPASRPNEVKWFGSRFLCFVFSDMAKDKDPILRKLSMVYRVAACVWWGPLLLLVLWALIPIVVGPPGRK